MILLKLRDFIISHPYCTKAQLMKVFSLSEDGIDAMLSIWVKKGKIQINVQSNADENKIQYLWVDDQKLGIRWNN